MHACEMKPLCHSDDRTILNHVLNKCDAAFNMGVGLFFLAMFSLLSFFVYVFIVLDDKGFYYHVLCPIPPSKSLLGAMYNKLCFRSNAEICILRLPCMQDSKGKRIWLHLSFLGVDC